MNRKVTAPHEDLTYRIIGAAMAVHRRIGPGQKEVIYQRALAWELTQAGLSFNREIEQDIFYKELSDPIGTRRADFVVEGKVLVELKAIVELEDVHLAQILNYLRATDNKTALLVNFGKSRLEYRRFDNRFITT